MGAEREKQSKKCENGRHGLNRALFVVIGTFFMGLAYISILLPILPQSPFLLIALASYARSSKRLEKWLLNNRVLGKHLKGIQQGSLRAYKTSINRRFLGIVIVKVFVLATVLFYIFGLRGLLFTLMIIVGKLTLFAIAIYVSGHIWRISVRET